MARNIGVCGARVVIALLALAGVSPLHAASFVTFESGQVRPLAMSPNGARLFAVNTPDGRLEVFDIKSAGLTPVASVPVGMEPVAVAARSNTEVWVVNHLSDSISIVDLSATPPRVVRTLLVGDEPRDIVFAGPGRNRAFITAAHRGQNTGFDPQLTTAGIGRADVWVFDAINPGSSLGGTPLTIVTLFTDTPRALAVSPDGATVYAAGFHTGNRTTTLHENVVSGGLGLPTTDSEGITGPAAGLIVKSNGASWLDPVGRDWSSSVRFNLPDKDVFVIDANASPPVATNSFADVGTVLFNMAVNPVSGKLYISNTEARNDVRFEGTRPATGPGSTVTSVQGHLHEARISIISGPKVSPRHLNRHIDYSVRPAPAGTKDKSLATPMGMAVSADGTTLYVAAMGSSKIGVFNVAQLESGTFVPDSANHIALPGGGPTGLVLDEPRGRLYALTRFNNSVAMVAIASKAQLASYSLHNPEPANVVNGRPFLYDAFNTSSNGEASCSSCHVFGDFDSLAWDLGNPLGATLSNPNPDGPIGASSNFFEPMKGPMTTQSLRGLANHGPMHWRGDRTFAHSGGNALDENGAFREFNVAFEGLLGRSGPLAAGEMQAFADFALEITYPPNPVRALDNSLTGAQGAGEFFFFNTPVVVGLTCNSCHLLSPPNGFFGSSGLMSFEAEPQDFKIPHLRNLYQKIGMFGMAATSFFRQGDNGNKGDQVRGFGFTHDGSTDTLFRFHGASLFSVTPTDQANLEQFMFAMDSNLAPIVGQQVTLTSTNAATVGPRIDLMIARQAAGECDLIVKGNVGGEPHGWLLEGGPLSQYATDIGTEILDPDLRALAATPGQELTYTAVPPGSGRRAGIDQDEDTVLDGEDNCPARSNADQLDADADSRGDVCDNCTALANADQRDTDGDGYGNRCDAEFDQSNLVNITDLGLFKARFGTNNADADLDGNGLVNIQDLGIFKSLFGKAPGPSGLQP
jgi:DNA-binding beta-propeller fold protein YncE